MSRRTLKIRYGPDRLTAAALSELLSLVRRLHGRAPRLLSWVRKVLDCESDLRAAGRSSRGRRPTIPLDTWPANDVRDALIFAYVASQSKFFNQETADFLAAVADVAEAYAASPLHKDILFQGKP